jgi:hypothetical protein
LKEGFAVTSKKGREYYGKVPIPFLTSFGNKPPRAMDVRSYADLRPLQNFWINITMTSEASVGGTKEKTKQKAQKPF